MKGLRLWLTPGDQILLWWSGLRCRHWNF